MRAQTTDIQARIVVAPGYYSFVFGKDKQALKEFFIAVADASPVPVLLYNVSCSSRRETR